MTNSRRTFFDVISNFCVLGLFLVACSEGSNQTSPAPQQERPIPEDNGNSQVDPPKVSVESNQNSIQKTLVDTACVSCHQTAIAKNRYVALSDIAQLIEDGTHSHIPGDARRGLIKPGCPRQSFFLTIMKEGKMPPAGKLPETDLLAVETWITELKPGANCVSDEPIDTAPEADEPGGDKPRDDEP